MAIRRPIALTPSPAARALRAHIRKNRSLGFGAGLGGYLRRVAQASAFAAMLSACGTSHVGTDGGSDTSMPDTAVDGGLPDTAMPDTGGPDTMPPPPPTNLCESDGSYRIVRGLAPAAEPNWLAAAWGGDFGGPPSIADEIGTRCEDSGDVEACLAAVDVLVSETYQRALITTTGSEIASHGTPEEVNTFLGDIDTAKEAALLVWHAGYDISCSGDFLSSVARVEDGYTVVAYQSSGGCGSPWVTTRFTLGVYDGTVVVEDSVIVAEEDDWGCVGRRPAGLTSSEGETSGAGVVADFFADISRLEESAVHAFDRMIDELTALGAPDALLTGAREAREDEVRHTHAMGELSRRFGAEPLVPTIEAVATRTPFEIALENAVEGCVRETFGALVGAHQALRAGDAAVASAMSEVAEDEIRHAELSWAVAGWLEPQLTEDERRRIAQAKRDAVMMLRQQAGEPVAPELIASAGLPDAETAVRMVEQLASDIWA